MPTSKEARRDFEDAIKRRGHVLLGKYVKNDVKVLVKCPLGHEFQAKPGYFKAGTGCPTCSGHDPRIARVKFFEAIAGLGGTVEGEYKGTYTKVSCKCKAGHACSALPHNIIGGHGMCRVCVGHDPESAKTAFFQRAKEAGVTVCGEYFHVHSPIQAVCKFGHTCFPTPASVQQGRGFCWTCSGTCPFAAEQSFLTAMIDRGFQVLGKYKTSHLPVKSMCPKGHITNVYPVYIQQGLGLCSFCRPRSRGEEKVKEALTTLDVNFSREFSFKEDRYKYDFHLPDLKIIIEADGSQHFQTSGYRRRERDLQVGQMIDVVKMAQASVAGYKMIRIDQSWYGKPVDDFVVFLRGLIIEQPWETLPTYNYSTPGMYGWVKEILPKVFWDAEEIETSGLEVIEKE